MHRQHQTSFDILKILNIVFIAFSVAICSVLMLLRIPGMELLETNPNWLLIWLVAWSIRSSVGQSAIAGLAIAWIYDGIMAASPSHVTAFILVGVLTSSLNKQKYLGEDFISVAFIVFFMTVIAETVFAIQYMRTYFFSFSEVWYKYQQIAIVSAIITSLWSPVFYYPFSLCQQKLRQLEKRIKN